MATKPLSGFRVLDLTNVLSGPFCCHQLAHLGAEVIKVENPRGGDLARRLGADPERNARAMGVSFLAQNAGKKSVTLNLKSQRGKELFFKLVETADVVVENYRPGVMERLGLGYERLREHVPHLVYCAISGFGRSGPLSDHPAYDQIIQGYSGVMSITGAPETAPYRVGFPMADTIGGLTAAMAINAALAAPKERRGTLIDVSMLISVLATMGWVVSNALIAGVSAAPRGNDNFTASPSGTFRTADGAINIAANKQEQFESLCRVLGAPELCDDPRFRERESRLAHRAALSEALETRLSEGSAGHWIAELTAAGVPAGPVLGVDEILRHAHVKQSGLLQQHASQTGERLTAVGSALRLDGDALGVDAPAPELGASNADIWGELGFAAQELEVLRAQGVL